MQLWNGLPQWPCPGFKTKSSIQIFPTGGLAVSYGYRTGQTGNCEMFLLRLCSPSRSFYSVCHTRSSPCLNLLTNAFIAPKLTIQGIKIHPTNFILPLQEKAFPPATQSCLPPPPRPCCSPVAKVCLLPPPQRSLSLVAGKANPATPATLTPPGLRTGKAMGCGPIADITNPATTQTILTPPIWILKMGPSKEANQASLTILAAVFGLLFGDR
jgi:hypothetical protein